VFTRTIITSRLVDADSITGARIILLLIGILFSERTLIDVYRKKNKTAIAINYIFMCKHM